MTTRKSGGRGLHLIVCRRIACFKSLRHAAKAMKIDPGYLSRLSTGAKANPSAETLRKLGIEEIVKYLPKEPS